MLHKEELQRQGNAATRGKETRDRLLLLQRPQWPLCSGSTWAELVRMLRSLAATGTVCNGSKPHIKNSLEHCPQTHIKKKKKSKAGK